MSKAISPREVLSAYRHLLRSISITFKDDQRVLTAAKSTVRARFEEGKKLAPASPEAFVALEEARGASRFLRQGVIQGVKEEESSNFRIYCCYRRNG